jgi:hypothetical protein
MHESGTCGWRERGALGVSILTRGHFQPSTQQATSRCHRRSFMRSEMQPQICFKYNPTISHTAAAQPNAIQAPKSSMVGLYAKNAAMNETASWWLLVGAEVFKHLVQEIQVPLAQCGHFLLPALILEVKGLATRSR